MSETVRDVKGMNCPLPVLRANKALRALAPGAELDDVPVLRSLHARGRLLGRRVRGRFLDVGVPAGWEEADALLRGAAAGA